MTIQQKTSCCVAAQQVDAAPSSAGLSGGRNAFLGVQPDSAASVAAAAFSYRVSAAQQTGPDRVVVRPAAAMTRCIHPPNEIEKFLQRRAALPCAPPPTPLYRDGGLRSGVVRQGELQPHRVARTPPARADRVASSPRTGRYGAAAESAAAVALRHPAAAANTHIHEAARFLPDSEHERHGSSMRFSAWSLDSNHFNELRHLAVACVPSKSGAVFSSQAVWCADNVDGDWGRGFCGSTRAPSPPPGNPRALSQRLAPLVTRTGEQPSPDAAVVLDQHRSRLLRSKQPEIAACCLAGTPVAAPASHRNNGSELHTRRPRQFPNVWRAPTQMARQVAEREGVPTRSRGARRCHRAPKNNAAPGRPRHD